MSDNNVLFKAIAGANDALRASMLGNMAELRSVSLEEIQAEFDSWLEENAEAERKARRKAREVALANEGKNLTFSDELISFLAKVKAAGGKATFTLNDDDEPEVTVRFGRKSGGGNGGGRVANDYKQPYVTAQGERVVGPITSWLDANFSAEAQKDIPGVFRPNGKRKSGSKLAKALVKAKILREEPVPAE